MVYTRQRGLLGAINTIVNNSGHLQGYNTDVTGQFQRSLSEAGFDPAGTHAVLWGAGGVARAVAWALIWRGVEALTIINRTAVRGGRLRHDLASASAGASLKSLGADDEGVADALHSADLVVQCTSIGLKGSETDGQLPFNPSHLSSDAFVADSDCQFLSRLLWFGQFENRDVARSVAYRCWCTRARRRLNCGPSARRQSRSC